MKKKSLPPVGQEEAYVYSDYLRDNGDTENGNVWHLIGILEKQLALDIIVLLNRHPYSRDRIKEKNEYRRSLISINREYFGQAFVLETIIGRASISITLYQIVPPETKGLDIRSWWIEGISQRLQKIESTSVNLRTICTTIHQADIPNHRLPMACRNIARKLTNYICLGDN